MAGKGAGLSIGPAKQRHSVWAGVTSTWCAGPPVSRTSATLPHVMTSA